jgi:poly(3-hydroxyalkanoate) synthetase
MLAFVDRALILTNLLVNRKDCMNWELGSHSRYIFNWMKPGKLINQEKYFGDICISIRQSMEYAGILG